MKPNRFKFRCWNGKKIIDNPTLEDDECVGEFSMVRINKAFEETKLILMQSTGLLDKNGVEIYEGDIIKMYNYDIAVMELADTYNAYGIQPMFKKQGKAPEGLIDTCDCKKTSHELSRAEIIGNIHKNPGLLKND